MKCENVKLKLNRYLDGELDEKSENEIKQHLSECEKCSAEFQSLFAIDDFLDVFEEESVDESTIDEIMSQIGTTKISFFGKFKKEIISIAASALLFGSLGTVLGSYSQKSESTSDNIFSMNTYSIYNDINWEK